MRHNAVPTVAIAVTATATSSRGFTAAETRRMVVFDSPRAAMAASSPTPDVTLANTPTAEAGYRRAASAQNTKPMAEVATVLMSRNMDPRYSASPATPRTARRIRERGGAGAVIWVMAPGGRRAGPAGAGPRIAVISAMVRSAMPGQARPAA